MISRQRALAGWLLAVPLLVAPLAQATSQHLQHLSQPRPEALPSDLWRVYLDARQNNSELAAAQADQAARAEAVPQARAGLLPTLSASADLNATSTSLQQPRQNLTLQASQFALEATQQTLSARKAGHAPTLDAVLRYQTGDNDALGYGNSDIRGNGYGGNVEQRTVALQLNIPLFSGGQTRSQVREAHQRMNQREYLNDGLRRQVVEQTRNLHRGLNSGVDQVQARRQSIISNQGAVLASQMGFQVGTRNIVDVLEAQRQLYNAVRQYNNSRYDYILDTLRLKQAVGTLSPQDLKALCDYLKADYDPDRDFLPPEFPRRLAKR